MVADTEAGTFEGVRNPAADAHGRYGEAAAEALIGSSVSAVIGTHFGYKAFRILSRSGLALYQARGGVVGELVEKCKPVHLLAVLLDQPGHGGIRGSPTFSI